MAVTLVGRQPYGRVLTYENVVDETGREMHKSWGNAIDLDDALERMGADTMRWLYCSQNPAQELRFGYGLAEEVKRRFLTFWNSVKFFVDYAQHRRVPALLAARAAARETSRCSTAGSSSARTRSCMRATAAYDAYDTVGLTRDWDAFSTTSRTGTSAARGDASGTETTRARSRRSGTRSCSRCAFSRRSSRSWPTTCGARSFSRGRSRCTLPAGRSRRA